jgi:hypothetical protein
VPVSRLVLFLESRYRGTKRVAFEQNDGALDATRMRPAAQIEVQTSHLVAVHSITCRDPNMTVCSRFHTIA